MIALTTAIFRWKEKPVVFSCLEQDSLKENTSITTGPGPGTVAALWVTREMVDQPLCLVLACRESDSAGPGCAPSIRTFFSLNFHKSVNCTLNAKTSKTFIKYLPKYLKLEEEEMSIKEKQKGKGKINGAGSKDRA